MNSGHDTDDAGDNNDDGDDGDGVHFVKIFSVNAPANLQSVTSMATSVCVKHQTWKKQTPKTPRR